MPTVFATSSITKSAEAEGEVEINCTVFSLFSASVLTSISTGLSVAETGDAMARHEATKTVATNKVATKMMRKCLAFAFMTLAFPMLDFLMLVNNLWFVAHY